MPKNKTIFQLALAQALMMSVNTLLLTSSAIIGLEIADNKSLATLPLAIQFFSTMLITFPASIFMQKYGRKKGFYLATFFGFIGAVIAIYSILNQDFILFCLSTLLFGIYTGFGNFFRFVAAEVSLGQKEINKSISYVLVGGILAAIIGPNLAIHSKDLFDVAYIGLFATVFLLYTLNLINFSFMTLPLIPISHDEQSTSRSLSEIAKQPTFMVPLITALLGYCLMAFLMTATPLSMKHNHFEIPDIAFVIQWHVLGMFVPSLFTGQLINRFGFFNISMTGAFFYLLCILINLLGTEITHYWIALILLGVGWNFLFISATTKITMSYSAAEKAKTQALNDFFIFTAVAIASLSAGFLQFYFGWQIVNLIMIPFVLIIIMVLIWYIKHQKSTIKNNHLNA
ncbi:MAG: MFS transporter [Gammaproteobacteria bacterium]|nr:MFS transporter [Gammaproteobacteria bacterium]